MILLQMWCHEGSYIWLPLGQLRMIVGMNPLFSPTPQPSPSLPISSTIQVSETGPQTPPPQVFLHQFYCFSHVEQTVPQNRGLNWGDSAPQGTFGSS